MTTATTSPEQARTKDGKFVYLFGGGKADGNADMKDLLGGKGAGLAEMTNIGIPVPPGFTITTEVCTEFYKNNRQYPAGLEEQVREGVAFVENLLGRKFGDPERPLLFSVRSGARVSMPGMMDTVLNLGINDAVAEGLARESGDRRFAMDSYRRFVQMYGDVVLDLKPQDKEEDPFEVILQAKKRERGVQLDTELTADDLWDLVVRFKEEIWKRKGMAFPEDPWQQLWGAIGAVFGSWENPRAVAYRRIYEIPSDWGTAVNVQAMVFGNLGDDCATGVAFTRDPASGEKVFYGEYLINAQGEDVVAGIRTPQPVTKAAAGPGQVSLEELMPDVFRQLDETREVLERHYRDMQDIEFTIQKGKLWLLQTRSGKRTAKAMVKIAVDFVKEGLISADEAILRIEPDKLNELLHPTFDRNARREVLATGLPASPGAAVGKIVFSADDAVEMANRGEQVILVRIETSPEDIHGMQVAAGILTARGGMTSHAAVVARGMGRTCVAGCGALQIDYRNESFSVELENHRTVTLRKGAVISLDGSTGEVMLGSVPVVAAELDEDFQTMMSWVDERRRLKVRTNADTPGDAELARKFGAEGIGLCRTEHMFFDPERILAVREMILAEDTEGRRRALEKILPMQRQDFEGIFRAMDGYPVTIRLLDPPLHEFLPKTEEEIAQVARDLGRSVDDVRQRNEMLHEANPMLGHRGCRLGVTYPEIYETQVRAIFEAAVNVTREGVRVIPEVMIPLVAVPEELKLLRALTVETAERIMKDAGVSIEYLVGTMIELPRACVVADRIADHADFFSFGTNDLTQTTYGISRDDSAHFVPYYLEHGILTSDPTVKLDQVGVGELIRIGIERGRRTKPALKVGICGEHGGEPTSVEFCHREGFDYVSASPYRVPIARVAAAQGALRDRVAVGVKAE
ncbi:MAG TPA: pyruvate, phosphate dikinase [Dehalococcoidia bacterium]|nr:pyruvate, phosphate dikinase [Dehalococcoidia bacterium]